VYGLATVIATLYIATNHGVFRLVLGSNRWERLDDDLTDTYVTAIAVSDDWLLAGTAEGRICRSPDRGETWERVYGAPADSTIAAAR
jgi:hypothetical protein